MRDALTDHMLLHIVEDYIARVKSESDMSAYIDESEIVHTKFLEAIRDGNSMPPHGVLLIFFATGLCVVLDMLAHSGDTLEDSSLIREETTQ